MRVGVFDSGLGGLTVVQAIIENLKGTEIFYIADTKNAAYGEKAKEEILNFSFQITNYLIENHQIDALVVACNTATSAAIKELREFFSDLIVVGAEPGIKPAISNTKTNKIGVLATPATLKGEKYQLLLDKLASKNSIEVYEQACVGLVQQIEDGKIDDKETLEMLNNWLTPMKENGVDTIVLGCTHYPLVANQIRGIMGEDTYLVETGSAIANRLDDLRKQSNLSKSNESITVFYTNDINTKMLDQLIDDYHDGGNIFIKENNE